MRADGRSEDGAALQSDTLGVGATVVQSIAGMYPSASMAFLPLFVFLSAGDLTWATFLLAALLLGCVAYCGMAYAKRLASPGSVYVYVAHGGGTGGGYMAAMAILWGYAVLAAAIVPFAAIYIGVLGSDVGIHNMSIPVETILGIIWVVILPAVSAVVGIRFSARLTTTFELFSVAVILAICVAALLHHGTVIDQSQLHFGGAKNIFLGLPLALAAYTGWESAAALGKESKDPFRAIPRALFISVGAVGLYYVIVSYIQVLAFSGVKGGLASTSSPLPDMATLAHVGGLGTVITVGILVSGFAGNTVFINAAARIVYSMADDGAWPKPWARLGRRATPVNAIVFVGIAMAVYPLISGLLNESPVAITAELSTLGAFGFMVAYGMVAVTSPLYLRRLGQAVSPILIAVAAIGTAGLVFVILANWLPPSFLPSLKYPYTILPYIFAGWMLLSGATYLVVRRRGLMAAVGQTLRSETPERHVLTPAMAATGTPLLASQQVVGAREVDEDNYR